MGSSPRFRIVFAFCGLFIGRRLLPSALFPLHFRQRPHNLSLILPDPLLMASYIFKPCCKVNKWSARLIRVAPRPRDSPELSAHRATQSGLPCRPILTPASLPVSKDAKFCCFPQRLGARDLNLAC